MLKRRNVGLVLLLGLLLQVLPLALVHADGSRDILGSVLGAGILLGKGASVEKLVGSMSAQTLEQQGDISDDSQLNARAQNIVSRLVASSGRRGLDYQVKVLNKADVNAYALPGGHLYINSGLLRLPGISDDELGFVLGHELAHTNQAHGLKQLKTSLAASLITGTLVPGDKPKLLAALAAQLYSAGRSRKDESEADHLGFGYAVKAGFDSSAGLAFMRRLETLSKGNPDAFAQLFATHPPTAQRAEWLKTP